MFNIEWIELVDFKAYRGKHLITLPKASGLYYLTGVNLVNPRVGSNATGKSTILDAIHWAIFGRTARGLKSGDVVGWHAKSCSVTVCVAVAGQKHTIKRTQNPNSLILDKKPVDDVTKLIRMNEAAFDYAVMLPQFGTSFFDLTPANKLSLFTEILALDFWLAKSAEAAKLAAEIEAAKYADDLALAKAASVYTAINQDINHLKAKEATFGRDKSNNLKNMKLGLDILEREIPKYEKQLNEIKRALVGTENRIRKLEVEDDQSRDLSIKYANLNTKMEILESDLQSLSGVGRECPKCRQKVSKEHQLAAQKDLQAQIGKLKTEIAQVAEALKQTFPARNDLEVVRKNHAGFSYSQKYTEDTLRQIREKVINSQKAIDAKANETNPYADLLHTKLAALMDLTKQKGVLKAAIERHEREHASVSYWVNGFKRVRLMIVEETLRQLEIEVNNNLGSLGLLDWRIEFDVERETKAGGISKGFVVFVHAPGKAEPVKFEAWSGGETQRLRMAGDLGLANLIMERAGLTNTIECIDEPSQHLSQEGLLDLAELLARRAENDEKRIILVDHHAIEFGGFTGIMTVTKDENGSTFMLGNV